MRKIMLVSIILLVVGCGDQAGPVPATPELEAMQRENEERVYEAESAWQKRPTTGDQEVEAMQRTHEERVHEAESAWQKQQPLTGK